MKTYKQIENATFYDRSQRTVVVEVGQVALVQNIYGFWAAIKLIAVENEYTEIFPPKSLPEDMLPEDIMNQYEQANINIEIEGEVEVEEKLVFDYEVSESYNSFP